MALNLTAAPAIVKIDAKKFGDKVKAYKQLCLVKKETAAAAAAADSAHKAARDEMALLMQGASAATCGNYVLTAKISSDAAPTITFATGAKSLWSDVTSVLIGNTTHPATGAKLYGGRAGSLQIEVAGG